MPEALPVSIRHARALARSLVDVGVRHIVISPGSRSTPLVLAFHEIDVAQKLVVLDERVASFTALGMSRAMDFPAALICTSGTAAANYYPAVIEAKQSGIPLVLLTADRSNLDRRNGAPQSMLQPGMFGDYTVFAFDAALPDTEESMARIEYLSWQAVDAALHHAGPSHINLPFDKPLEPPVGSFGTLVPARSISRVVIPPKYPVIAPSDLPETAVSAKRPLVIAGPAFGVSSIVDIWASRLAGSGIPVLASHASGLTHSSLSRERVRGCERILHSHDNRAALAPDLIIRLGHYPASKPLELYLEDHATVTEWSVLAAGASGSPQNPSGFRLFGTPSAELVRHWSDELDSTWLKAWSDRAPEPLRASLEPLTDGAVHRTVLENLPSGRNVFVSNSLPIRDLDLFGSFWDSDHNPVYSARGVSGIDGVTSQAAGVALGSKRDTVLLTGDLAFLHDSNALMLQRTMGNHRLLVVVINNKGGQIFKSLPIAHYEDIYDRYFGTPQETDIGLLCQAHGVQHRRATTADQIRQGMMELGSTRGIAVIECITDPEVSQRERQSRNR